MICLSDSYLDILCCCLDVILSSIGAAIWAVVIAVWVYIFQTHRAEWGEFGDQISFIIPTGMK